MILLVCLLLDPIFVLSFNGSFVLTLPGVRSPLSRNSPLESRLTVMLHSRRYLDRISEKDRHSMSLRARSRYRRSRAHQQRSRDPSPQDQSDLGSRRFRFNSRRLSFLRRRGQGSKQNDRSSRAYLYHTVSDEMLTLRG